MKEYGGGACPDFLIKMRLICFTWKLATIILLGKDFMAYVPLNSKLTFSFAISFQRVIKFLGIVIFRSKFLWLQ